MFRIYGLFTVTALLLVYTVTLSKKNKFATAFNEKSWQIQTKCFEILMNKQNSQVSGLCDMPFLSYYPPKHSLKFNRAECGDAVMMCHWLGTNMAAGMHKTWEWLVAGKLTIYLFFYNSCKKAKSHFFSLFFKVYFFIFSKRWLLVNWWCLRNTILYITGWGWAWYVKFPLETSEWLITTTKFSVIKAMFVFTFLNY